MEKINLKFIEIFEFLLQNEPLFSKSKSKITFI